jgi:hypothetical protein
LIAKKAEVAMGADRDMIEQELFAGLCMAFSDGRERPAQELLKVSLTHLDHADRVVPVFCPLKNT